MTIASQALSGRERDTFKEILQKHKTLSEDKKKKLAEQLAQITKEAIDSSGVAIKGQINSKMVDLIKARILNNREFNPNA
jgi:hypothetical protein